MNVDISETILSKLANFAVGLVRRNAAAGSEAFGSGILVSIEGRRGILTCGHVAEQYEKLPEIGLVHFLAAGKQRRLVPLENAQTIITQSEGDWSKDGFDLAFTNLPPELADSIAAKGVFLNLEINQKKVAEGEPTGAGHVDVLLGLVAEFSGEPFIEGDEFVSPMRGVLHSGNVVSQAGGLLTMGPMDYNREHLPDSFGGMSGSGLWRVHFHESEEGVEIIKTTLYGVASWEMKDGSKRNICQGWDRIEQGLIPKVRENLQ